MQATARAEKKTGHVLLDFERLLSCSCRFVRICLILVLTAPKRLGIELTEGPSSIENNPRNDVLDARNEPSPFGLGPRDLVLEVLPCRAPASPFSQDAQTLQQLSALLENSWVLDLFKLIGSTSHDAQPKVSRAGICHRTTAEQVFRIPGVGSGGFHGFH